MKKLILFLLMTITSCTVDNGSEENKPTFTLTVTAGEGGEVDTAGGTYDSGTVVTVQALPDSYHSFDGWSGTEISTDNPIEITLNNNENIEANFIHQLYGEWQLLKVNDNGNIRNMNSTNCISSLEFGLNKKAYFVNPWANCNIDQDYEEDYDWEFTGDPNKLLMYFENKELDVEITLLNNQNLTFSIDWYNSNYNTYWIYYYERR